MPSEPRRVWIQPWSRRIRRSDDRWRIMAPTMPGIAATVSRKAILLKRTCMQTWCFYSAFNLAEHACVRQPHFGISRSPSVPGRRVIAEAQCAHRIQSNLKLQEKMSRYHYMEQYSLGWSWNMSGDSLVPCRAYFEASCVWFQPIVLPRRSRLDWAFPVCQERFPFH